MYLRQEILGSHNRAGHKLREEAEVEEVVRPTLSRLNITTIDINHITERLEGEEGDTHREEDIAKRDVAIGECREHFAQQTRILKVAEHPEVEDYRGGYQPLTMFLLLGCGEEERYRVVGQRHQKYQQEVYSARLVVEEEREEGEV